MKIQDPAKVAAEAAAKAASRPAQKAAGDGASKSAGKSSDAAKAGSDGAAKKRVSVVQQVADAAGVVKKPAAPKAPAKSVAGDGVKSSPAKAPAADGAKPATAEAPKKLKKKGIVIFKGNANE